MYPVIFHYFNEKHSTGTFLHEEGPSDRNVASFSIKITNWLLLSSSIPLLLQTVAFCSRWKQYRELLQMRDSWDRTIFEHAIVSGRQVVFDAVFDAIRMDVYDEEVRAVSA